MQEGLTISGTVAGMMGNHFILDDGSGQIIVDAGPPWWRALELALNEQVTVVGQPEQGGFEAFSITRADGTVIDIRPSAGPPPWAGPPWLRESSSQERR